MELGWEIKALTAGGVLAALWIGESCFPFYAGLTGKFNEQLRHDAKNLAFGLANAALLALLFSAAIFTVSSLATSRGFGLVHLVDWPPGLEILLLFVLFDIWMYVWHRANHEVSFLWRFHRMHHSDPNMTASTALRFHPGEMLISATARLAVLPLLGMTLWNLALYETVLLPVIFFQHSNISLPRRLDRGLLAVVVTPAMHRVHHSRIRAETNSNYGTIFPYWDVLGGSFRLRDDAHTIDLGLDGMDSRAWQSVAGMLQTPLRSLRT